jgi:hypothetical protein
LSDRGCAMKPVDFDHIWGEVLKNQCAKIVQLKPVVAIALVE